MTADRPLLGIVLMLGFCALAPVGDAMAKVLGDSVPLAQILLVRFALQAVILVPLSLATRRSLNLNPRVFRLTALRTALHIVGIGAMFASLRFLPLADAIAIVFVMPFILLLLGRYVLDEEVGPRRLAACVVGFVGTMLVIQPSFAEVGAPALLPLVVAVSFALFMLVTRRVAKDVDAVAMQAVSGVMATGALFALCLVGVLAGVDGGPLALVAPTRRDWTLLLAVGGIGTFAHLLMTWSLRFAPSATLAPMQYLEIPIATFVGWLVFSDLPDGLAAIGICVTIASGLYIVFRERALSRAERRRAASARPQAPPAV